MICVHVVVLYLSFLGCAIAGYALAMHTLKHERKEVES